MANAIEKYPVPLIFKKILKDRMSGELVVIHPNFKKKMFFIKGKLSFAATTIEEERLGDLLCAMGKISKDQLHEVSKVKAYSSPKRKVGEILVEISSITMRDIYYALIYQIKVIATSTFDMTEGEWRFMVKHPEINNTHKFNIRLQELIPDGVSGIKDFSYYKRRFSLRSPVTAALGESVQKHISADLMKFYIELSNFTNEPVTRIIPEMNFSDEDFWKHIVSLYLMNLVDFVEYTIDEEVNDNIEQVNELYQRIKSEKMDYYQLLGLENASAIEQVKKSYFDYSKKYHPDRIIAAPDSTVKLKATEVFAEINRAFETLSDEDKKREYDARGLKSTLGGDAERANNVRKARNLYKKANTMYKLKRYFEAASAMEEAVQWDDSKASFWLLLGLAHSKSPATKNRAEECLKKAAEMEPWNADHVFALGELYKSENLMKKADIYFNKALEINMEHTLAGKAKEELDKLFSRGKKKPLFSIFGKKK
jgi:curved DNA-binding protein CbpA